MESRLEGFVSISMVEDLLAQVNEHRQMKDLTTSCAHVQWLDNEALLPHYCFWLF
eukprot:m.171506 g.171506  ORF g.171506 m.171506 type:complete len:55 (+) comp39056_c1_seq6:285-449(+)